MATAILRVVRYFEQLRNVSEASGYAPISDVTTTEDKPIVPDTGSGETQLTESADRLAMATRKVPPPPSGKSKSEGQLTYVQLVFDEQTEKAQSKPTKSSSTKLAKDDSEKIIYTQIVPKNLRKADDGSDTETVKKSEEQTANKKADRGKVFKNLFAKFEDKDRKTPSPPPNANGRESPIITKSRTQPQTHTYENHSVTPSVPANPSSHTYMNVSALQTTPMLNPNLLDADFMRRASIEPPPAPSVEAPKPSKDLKSFTSEDTLSPMVSRVRAKASYDGPMISGMLMFTKGDVATLMSKAGSLGWWYVNLKGLEGYVPGGFWESYSESSSGRVSPPSRGKAPQPMPRSRSPPLTQSKQTEKNPLDDEAWYHGKMSRPESEKLLSSCANGVFIIRESVNRVGDLTLSVKWEAKVRHFPIEAKEGGLYYIGKHDFKTLQGVINHYSKHALFYSDSNEAVKLKSPALKRRPS